MNAKELLSDPTRWTRKTRARRHDDSKTDSQSPEATCWCLVGAVEKCYGRGPAEAAAIEKLADVIADYPHKKHPSHRLAQFNDNCTHAQLLEVLELAGV